MLLAGLLMLNAPQGTIDKNCVLGSDWQLPHGAGGIVGYSLACVNARSGGSWKCRRERFLHYAREMWSCYHKNSAHRPEFMSIMNRPVLSVALFGCNIRRVIF
ncbi:transcriptional regulator YkgD [Escherichia coli]|uniref:Transcriptional regulator YkgD n=1 Tax=Escherichia coli TaxID=562 RepID=A0A377KDE2_ECOLX|nr:transcriptional regulator YkgD [Escherichia coli]